MKVIEKTKADLAYSRPLWVEPDGRMLPRDFFLDDPHFKLRVNSVPSSCVLHRLSCFDRVGYWNEEIERNGDWDLWQRIQSASPLPPAYYPKQTSFYFRAKWRSNSNVASRLIALPAIHAQIPALRLPPPPAAQEIAWRRVES